MRPRTTVIATVLAVLAGLQLPALGAPESMDPATVRSGTDQTEKVARAAERYGQLPLYFTENRGQLDPRVTFAVQGGDSSVYFTSRGVTFSLAGTTKRDAEKRHTLKLDFVGARAVKPVGREASSAKVNFFRGDSDQWIRGSRTHTSIVYRDLWPGIDLVYSGTSSRLKYTLRLAPGADPDRIRFSYRGGTAARISRDGALQISTPVGRFSDDEPSAFQMSDRGRVDVATRYRLREQSPDSGTEHEYGLRVGRYDPHKPLVIDPAFLVYAGLLGGVGDERGLGVSVDALGNAYVVGQTSSASDSFPVEAGPQVSRSGNLDAFVAKVNADGTALVYAGYIGGAGNDAAFDVSVDASGSAYVTGFTTSSQATFPVAVGPDLTFNGSEDSFVAKVNAAGTSLVYAGYIGGGGTDFGEGIAVDAAGNAHISGTTGSNQRSFPTMGGPDLTYNGGRFDTYVAKVDASGAALVYAGYVGGTGNDVPVSAGRDATVSGGHIALDADGNAYLSGTTTSHQSSFPDGNGFDGLPGPDSTFNGRTDAFVVKVNAAGSGLVYAGYIGGAKADRGFGMAVDSGGNAYLTGDTESTQATFPVVMGPDLTFNGMIDTFVAKVRPDGTQLVYAGYLGGADGDQGLGVAIHETSDGTSLHVVGHTHSSAATFPLKSGPDLTYNGAGENGDAFVAELVPVPSAATVTDNLVYSGYLGGTGEDAAFWVDVDADGNTYVVGDTDSNGFTFPDGLGFGSLPSFRRFNSGGVEAFVAKVVVAPPPENDEVANATTISTLPFTTTASTRAATSTGDPAPCGSLGRSVWYAFTPTTDTSLAADTFGSDFDTVLAVYTGTSPSNLSLVACNDNFDSPQSQVNLVVPGGTTAYFQAGGWLGQTGELTFTAAEGPAPPTNDDFLDATAAGGFPYTDNVNTVLATREVGESMACASFGKTVWYSFTTNVDMTISANTFGSDFDTVLAAYTGSTLSTLVPLACNDQAAATNQSRIRVSVRAGQVVHLQAGGWSGDSGDLVVNVKEAPLPPNDDFAQASPLGGLPFTQSLSTDAATSQAGEPSPCGSIANTVWYSYTPNADMTISANTFGSTYDTVLAAYTGTSLSGLTTVACNDQPALMKQSRVSFDAQAGVTVYFQVGGKQGDTGSLTFNVAESPPPQNDDFADALVVGSTPFTDSQHTPGATAEAGEPAPCDGGGKTVWYAFTPSTDMTVVADTLGSDFDTVLAAYTGSTVTSLTMLGCNDQAASGNQSRVTVDLQGGTTVYFQAAGWQGDTGNLKFSLAESLGGG